MGGPAAIDMGEYACAETLPNKEERPAEASVSTKEGPPCPSGTDEPEEKPADSNGLDANSPMSVMLPYMRKCLYSILHIAADQEKDVAEKTRLFDLHLCALTSIAYVYGKTGKKPDTLEILDDGTVVPKNKEEA